MAVGASVLLGLALLVGEPLTLPTTPATWGSLLYLALVGSVGLFMLTLYVLARWSASATAYATLAMPLVTVVVAALLLGETVGPLFLVGAALVLLGVYAGISAARPRRHQRPVSEAGP
jgi:drug/metabolite transporter (DMT)-like permease